MRIYTRRGDKGQSSLLSGERVDKDDPRLKTFGALDELQTQLGMARALIQEDEVQAVIYSSQEDIMVASSELASTPATVHRLENRLGTRDVEKLEATIDRFMDLYGLPGGFVVPGNSLDSAAVHVARAVCRRCERLIVTLNRGADVYNELVVYFNRLSDLLFVLAWSLEVRAMVEDVVRRVIATTSKEGR
jgi:cob(I)alamin adenosyltransferase